ncbi:ribonuclease R [Lachnospiraceae bacterium KHCPX20]|nr:ribonuclease R [Lachnospiraceae bacterium KHCPX20]
MTEERITRQKELIYELMGDCMYMPMKEKELASLLILNKAQRKELSRVLKELLEEKKIICGSDGRYQRAKKVSKKKKEEPITVVEAPEKEAAIGKEPAKEEQNHEAATEERQAQEPALEKRASEGHYLEGIFTSNAKGFGFVTVEGMEQDFFIPEKYTLHAFHKDTVRIEPMAVADEGRRAEAKIVDIVAHEYIDIVGTFERSENFGFVVPDDRHLVTDIFIPQGKTLGAVDGHKVVCHLSYYGSANRKPEGEITEILGHKDDPGVDILSIIKTNEIPVEFPEEVLEEAKKVSGKGSVPAKDRRGRKDLRDWMMVTIDGEESKDLDDAVSLQKDGEHYILGVHIADVSNYVKEDSLLDREALKRSTSVYLLDRVIPMLPHILSNGICSLNENVDRLALSCIMTIDQAGAVLDYEICESVIRTTRRMTYTAVNRILEDHDPETMEEYKELVPMFRDMEQLAYILHGRRNVRGSIDFDFPETVVELNDEGKPVDIHPYIRGISQRIIEDFMLAANETVARFAFDHKLPFLYRTHDFPKGDKLENLAAFVGGFGYSLKGNLSQIHPKELQKLLARVEGAPEEELIQTLTLRSMQQAKYTTECSGHFGLAAGYYCHFTSPIRRYPDLQIHRILKENLKKKLTKKRMDHYEEILESVAERTSKLERRAESAERDVTKLKKVEYMADHIGEEFEGKISGVTGWGLYVALPNSVEGMIPVRTMEDDFYDFVEESYELVGQNFNRHYRLGMPLTVRLVSADTMTRTIDFMLVDDGMGGGVKHHPERDTLERHRRPGGFSGKDKKASRKRERGAKEGFSRKKSSFPKSLGAARNKGKSARRTRRK